MGFARMQNVIASAIVMLYASGTSVVLSTTPPIHAAKFVDGHRGFSPMVATIFRLASHEKLSEFIFGHEYAIFYISDSKGFFIIHAYGMSGVNIRFEPNDFGRLKFRTLTISGRRIGPFRFNDITISN